MDQRAKKIKYIVIHCQGGHGDLASVQAYWRKTLGWKSPGYHIWIDYDGTKHFLSEFNKVTNGVLGFNDECIHICYRGGVNLLNHEIIEDTRNIAQRSSILESIFLVANWLKENGKDTTKDLMILGHRDFSKDMNKNGKIESFEREKGCPSFDAIPEYQWLTITRDNPPSNQVLPKNRTK